MAKKEEKFDFEAFKQEARKRAENGERDLLGKNGLLTPLIKEFLEESLEGELDAHLDEDPKSGNRRNGKGSKTVKTELGPVEIKTPRDRDASFDPKMVPKRSRQFSGGLDKQIISLYARGASYGDIRDFLEETYGVEVSVATISRVTDKVLPLMQEWRTRPLEAVYPFVWMDAIHYKVREEGRVVNKAVYCVIGVNSEGFKDLLGLYLGAEEGAKFWMNVLDDLKNRGVQDMLIASIDNLTGFVEAIEAVFPQTTVQLCIIHQIRNSKKYLAWKDTKAFMSDLRMVYTADTREAAERYLEKLAAKWESKYPAVIRSWQNNWTNLSQYFDYPKPIRKIIYTTNMIEGFHRQLRKVTKTKGAFTSDDALMKLLFLVQEDITAKWQRPVHNWNSTLAQLSIIFGDRLKLDL